MTEHAASLAETPGNRRAAAGTVGGPARAVAKPKVTGSKMVHAPGKPVGGKTRKGAPPKEMVNRLDPDLEQRKRVG